MVTVLRVEMIRLCLFSQSVSYLVKQLASYYFIMKYVFIIAIEIRLQLFLSFIGFQ